MPLDLAVLGQDPRFGGGGLAQTEAFLTGARSLGREPSLLYDPHPGLGDRRLTWRRVEALRQRSAARKLTVPARDARSLWVAATLAQHGGAAPRTGRAYACWIGTTIESEWSGRAPGLDRAHRAVAGASIRPLRRIERAVLERAARLYATSAASRASIAAAAGVAEADVGILPIPVDTAHFRPEAEATWVSRLSAPIVGFVGRLDDPRKNVDLLVRAFALVRRELPAARLRLIGSGSTVDAEGVEATGAVPDVAEPLRECAILVSPSRQEGFGIAVAEALACGVPAITTPSGGPEEMVQRSGAGQVMQGFSERELADAIVSLLRDEKTLTDLRRRGRAYVEREHATEHFRELLTAAFADLDAG